MGIDYGNGKTNINVTTMIRYGVISIHAVGQSWYDEAEPIDGNGCPFCGGELEQETIDNAQSYCGYDRLPEDEGAKCPHCEHELCDLAFMENEPIAYIINDGEYRAEQSAGDTDIFVTEAPYYALCDYCSPCAPGAGYLTSEGDVKTYCFGKEWFEDEKCPYAYFSVKTGEPVYSPEGVAGIVAGGRNDALLSELEEAEGVAE